MMRMVTAAKELWQRYQRNETGATAIEYSLIAILVSVGAIASYTNLGAQVSSTWNDISNAMTKATGN